MENMERIWIVILISLILIILSGFGGYYVGKAQGNSNQDFPFVYKISNEIFLASGQVTEIGNNFIRLDNKIKVNINDATEIINIQSGKEGSIKDIEKGSFVVVGSNENIKDKIEFTAIGVVLGVN